VPLQNQSQEALKDITGKDNNAESSAGDPDPHPDPLVTSTDPAPDPSPSKNNKKNHDFYCFVTFYL
jgi:hypothetical protein